MNYKPTQEEFERDVAGHTMTVLLDQGIYRHLRFKRSQDTFFWFDIITAPGILVFTGDMGGYTFRRLKDMFEFFRAESRINPSYWAEKVEAQCKTDGVKRFSREQFSRAVCEYAREWARKNRYQCTRDERRTLWDEIKDEVLAERNEVRMYDATNDFHHKLNANCVFYFRDFWEQNFDEFARRFIWCCRAIAWAIQRYDEATADAQGGAA